MALIRLNNQSISSVTALPSGIATGKVLQVVTNSATSTITSSTNTRIEVINASITPSSASNKILIFSQLNIEITASTNAFLEISIHRGDIDGTNVNNINHGHTADEQFNTIITPSFLDTPSTTSSQQYTVGVRKSSSGTTSWSTQPNNPYNITLMEIEG
jgi:hypothetical protein